MTRFFPLFRKTPRAGRLLLWLAALCGAAVTMAADLPTAEEYQANWPRFRGPGGGGVTTQTDLPLTCDFKSGANVAWKVPVPAPGFSSPVVWGERVFLSGGDEKARVVMGFDAPTGKLLWQRAVKIADASDEEVEVPDQCGMAAATMATDGRRVYAMFANGDLAALDFEGAVVWAKRLAVPKNQYGHATSLVTWQDRLLVQFDQGMPEDELSKLYALDGATGAVVWEKPRNAGASWATPIVFEAAGQVQIVTLAVPWVVSYAVKDGTELWRADCLDGEVTPSPIFAGGTLFIISPTNKLQAIRPDGHGDVTKTHLLWSREDNIPDVTSPASNGDLVFFIDTGGTLTCCDAKDGKKQWQQEMGEECNASPSLAGDRLYLFTKKGTMIVVEAARTFKELARSPLGEPVLASPAFAQHRIFVRGLKRLLCLEAGAASPAKR
ncbi:MAG TPA: PQQ-binding-like beta-propeller repeat protein [Chthoniobacteraceae bacterium]|nr:PQQ-binding-like beta-propeller repeat protein [Chthoniobacteraceae bacterium]